MNAIPPSPANRTEFDRAMAAVLAEHGTLRRLAAAATRHPASADDTLSLADAMNSHESAEARLFALPFLTRLPGAVTATGARARQRCLDYTSGNFRLPGPDAAAALFVDALLAHLAAEEAWLGHERERQQERLRSIP